MFSYVGYESQSVAVGTSSSINMQLQAANELEEVIITALGLERETAELGYAVSKVDGGEISQRPEGDIGRLLIGKAAGLNITSSNGLSGSSTNITIRGYTSITGSNQPLFVVDGVPFGSDTNNSEAFFDSATETSRFLDLDLNNIREINVLKGLSATALYGNRGRNGVILITTKNTTSKSIYALSDVKITVSSSAFWSNPHLADYQNEYGGGFDQEFGWYFSNWGPRFGTQNAQVFGTWLSEIRDGKVFLKHPFRFNSIPEYITGYEELSNGEYEYKAYESVPNFFRTGQFFSNSININGSSENVSYNVSYTKTNDEGFTPANDLSKDNLSIGGGISKNNLKIKGSSAFLSPFRYSTSVVCAPPAGTWTIEMEDSYGDGWNGAKIVVNLNGEETDYTITEGSSGSGTVEVPEGSSALVFTFVSVDWDSEVTFNITSPSGIVTSGGPTPTAGPIKLSVDFCL